MAPQPPRTGIDLVAIRPYRWVGLIVILIVLLAVLAVILANRPESLSQRRAQFRSMVTTLRSDVAACNTRTQGAVSAWEMSIQDSAVVADAEKKAQAAAAACDPSSSSVLFNLTVYSVPSSLPNLRLNYAVSCLGVWAQEDVRPALQAVEDLLREPGDQAAALSYRQESGFAAANLASANLVLQRAARKLGVTGVLPLRLTSLSTSALDPTP
ncbi:MAG: hypothetical protein WBA31_07840 [Candidatus Dormiibacterota bacterium]